MENVKENIDKVKEELKKNNINAIVFQEMVFKSDISFNNNRMEVMAGQGAGDIDDGMYPYIEGTPPANCGEIAVSNVVADYIGANIGDMAEVQLDGKAKKYIITAVFQSMQNMGTVIRLFHNEDTSSKNLTGVMGIQVRYKDNPGSDVLSGRKKLLKKICPDEKVYSAGGYVSSMMGDITKQLGGVKNIIFGVVLCINVLVTVLMVKSFIIKEKSGIAILKAIGFKSLNLAVWQTLRIVIILVIAVVLGILLSGPLSSLIIAPVFCLMGAYNIEFDVNAVEVYLIYPFAVLATTSAAAFLVSKGLRKVQVSQASNAE